MGMEEIKKDLVVRYKKNRLISEIFLWQIHIIENPKDRECYEKAIKNNLDELRKIN